MAETPAAYPGSPLPAANGAGASAEPESKRPIPVAEQFDDVEQQHESAALGIWIFLTTEVLFFGAVLMGYTMYRVFYFADFKATSHHLYLSIGTANTVVLLTSSLLMALAVHATRSQHWQSARRLLLATILVGARFVVLKGLEYALDYREGLVPGVNFNAAELAPADPAHAALFLAFYWIMTGIHALHVLTGLGIMAVLLITLRLSREPQRYENAVENTGMFWHLVDIIWIFLYPLLYLLGA